jgi:hypothetical protein
MKLKIHKDIIIFENIFFKINILNILFYIDKKIF